LTNGDIAELLATEAENASYPVQRALRKAGRAAFLWPREAAEMAQEEQSLTELRGVGPYIEKLILGWLQDPPRIPQRQEIRRGFLTWPQAQQILEQNPDWKMKTRGDLQMHTEWSDGSGSVRSMAEAGLVRGYEYIAITDHGKQLKIAGGINERELEEQGREIEEVNGELSRKGLKVLRSIELNLDTEGHGDMNAEALAKLDLVLGAFHSSLRRTEDQTERYLAALRNPHLHILGHPRGRIYNYREGLKADWERVFDEAAQSGKAMEIDCYPDRQDLSIDLIKLAARAGVMISLGTDSHHPWQLEFMDLGLAAALAGGVRQERILNFKTTDELMEWSDAFPRKGSKAFHSAMRVKQGREYYERETHDRAKKRRQAATASATEAGA
jgi:histidinol phosphatase-like PHP family hydrolase